MPKHPWSKELGICADTHCKTISTTTYRAGRNSSVDDVIKSVCRDGQGANVV